MSSTPTIATAHVTVPPLTARLATEAGQEASMRALRAGLTMSEAKLAYDRAYRAVTTEAGK